jgi:ATP-dependent 26S proteasome regulatory subunit
MEPKQIPNNRAVIDSDAIDNIFCSRMALLRERRVHVKKEDFEMAVAKVMKKDSDSNVSLLRLWKYMIF